MHHLRMNKKIRKYIQDIIDDNKNDDRLVEIIGIDFIEKNDCIFLKHFEERIANAFKYNIQDKTGIECFVNSFHPDDYVDGDHLAAGFSFLMAVLDKWNKLADDRIMVGILTRQSKKMSNVKFHILREGEVWLTDDLESYTLEGVMTTSSRDLCPCRVSIGCSPSE